MADKTEPQPESQAPAAPKENSSPAGAEAIRAPLRGEVSRRGFIGVLGGAWIMFTGAMALGSGALLRFLFPNVQFEPPQEFKAGFPSEYAVDAVDTRYKASNGVWIVRESDGFYVLSTVCTHLGCTPNWLSAEEKFKCPCHGSGFIKSGVNVEGPAPRPLERFKVTEAADGQLLIDKNQKYQEEKGQWSMDGAFLNYKG
ncbi:MAG: cytochrome b6-f complex iron-sulfur subunit [Planctomycetota bacterium]